jgi:hypothetical protein
MGGTNLLYLKMVWLIFGRLNISNNYCFTFTFVYLNSLLFFFIGFSQPCCLSPSSSHLNISISPSIFLFLLSLYQNFFCASVLSPDIHTPPPTFDFRGQFHQPYNSAKQKCTSSHSLAPVGAVQFTNKNTPNFNSKVRTVGRYRYTK